MNKYIRIINSYEDFMGFHNHEDLEESLKKEKEIKKCKFIINDKPINFAYYYTFEKEGFYTIKYIF